jgi:hypothetical protein
MFRKQPSTDECRRRREDMAPSLLQTMEGPMPQPKDDLSRSLVAFDQHSSLVAVIELSLDSWLVGAIVPGIARNPLKKLAPDQEALLKLLHRWRDEAVKAGREIKRIAVAFEAGRDGVWLARWLLSKGIEAYVIHPTSVAVSREQRRAKTDRLDLGLLQRLAGSAVSGGTAAWSRSHQSKRKMRSGRTASASSSSASARVSSTG